LSILRTQLARVEACDLLWDFLYFVPDICDIQNIELPSLLKRETMDGGLAKTDKGSETRDERFDLKEELEKYVANDKHGASSFFLFDGKLLKK